MKKSALFLILSLLLGQNASAFDITINGTPNCFPQPIQLGVNDQWDPNLTRGANIGWVRVTFQWRTINPSNGTWDFSQTDGIVGNALAQGLKVLAVLSTAPVWAGSDANGAKPPSNIAYWETFVTKVAQRYNGQISAYEIWNEPNLRNSSSDGIGWDQDLNVYPLYVDYLHAAAVKIRTYAPGTLVVGPVTSSQPDTRTQTLFQQLENTVFNDGPASNFLDVVSFHANGHENETVATVKDHIDSHLGTLSGRNPSNRHKPIWITEFGWKSNVVGEGTQRDRIRDLVLALTGSQQSGDWYPATFCGYKTYKFTHAFIYKIRDTSDESRGIHRPDGSPKTAVTGYTRTLPFPARHPNYESAPITYTCTGRTCTFTSPVVDTTGGYQLYFWDFGDGTTNESGTGTERTITHTYAVPGQYFVSSASAFIYIDGSDVQLLKVN